jgi:hypothetical protein
MAFAAALGSLSTLQAVGAAASAVSAIGQIQAGRQQARAYEAQAKQAELQGKQRELQYRQQGVQILRDTRQNISTVTARAAAGGLAPYSGTPDSLKLYAQATGTEESYLARENAELARVAGEINSQQYQSAASQARRQGFMNAVGTIGGAAMQIGSIGGPSGGINPSTATARSVGTPSMMQPVG